jgi:hypothetical protein
MKRVLVTLILPTLLCDISFSDAQTPDANQEQKLLALIKEAQTQQAKIAENPSLKKQFAMREFTQRDQNNARQNSPSFFVPGHGCRCYRVTPRPDRREFGRLTCSPTAVLLVTAHVAYDVGRQIARQDQIVLAQSARREKESSFQNFAS